MAREQKKLDFGDPAFIAACIIAAIADGALVFGFMAFAFPLIGPVIFFMAVAWHYFSALLVILIMFAWFKKGEALLPRVEDFKNAIGAATAISGLKELSGFMNFLLGSRLWLCLICLWPLPPLPLSLGILVGAILQSKLVRMVLEQFIPVADVAVDIEEVAEVVEGLAEATEAAAETAEVAAEGAEAAAEGAEGAAGAGVAEPGEPGAESGDVVGAEGTTEQAQREAQGEPRKKKPGEKEEEPEGGKEEEKKEKEEPDLSQEEEGEEEGEDEDEDNGEEIDLSGLRPPSGGAAPESRVTL